MEKVIIKWIEIKVWTKIKIYWNQKALGVPKWYFTIKRFYKVNNNDHIELKNSLNHAVVWQLKILELVDFKKV
jgi:hypothetical protein